jgi:hypothetical protein
VEPIIESLASHGIVGVIAALALWAAWRKDKELTAERKERLQDAKDGMKLALEIQGTVNKNVDKLREILDAIKGGGQKP